MNTLMLVLAVVCIMLAIIGAFRKDPGTAATGTVGAVLFAILAIALGGGDRERDRWDT
jgi:hypothetical protein